MLSTEEFKRCAQEYMDMVFRVAFSCLRSQADAEDVSHETLTAICNAVKIPVIAIGGITRDNVTELSGSGICGTYNECRKFWRRLWRRHENIDDYAEQLAFEEADCQDLFTAVMKLDRSKRIVVVLYYLEGDQIQEIAGILKIPPGTVGTRLARARKELRKYLEEEVSV